MVQHGFATAFFVFPVAILGWMATRPTRRANHRRRARSRRASGRTASRRAFDSAAICGVVVMRDGLGTARRRRSKEAEMAQTKHRSSRGSNSRSMRSSGSRSGSSGSRSTSSRSRSSNGGSRSGSSRSRAGAAGRGRAPALRLAPVLESRAEAAVRSRGAHPRSRRSRTKRVPAIAKRCSASRPGGRPRAEERQEQWAVGADAEPSEAEGLHREGSWRCCKGRSRRAATRSGSSPLRSRRCARPWRPRTRTSRR